MAIVQAAPETPVTAYVIAPLPVVVAGAMFTEVVAPVSEVVGTQVMVCESRPTAKVFVVETAWNSVVSATVATTEQDPAPVKLKTLEAEDGSEQPVVPALLTA